MMPEFVIAASPFLIARRAPSALWYVHKSVTFRLKLAERLVHYIFTASSFSFRLPSKKVIYTGHAIDTAFFHPPAKNYSPGGIHLLTVGRISPVKDIETIIRACAILKSTWDQAWLYTIVGGPAMARDVKYFESLVSFVRSLGLESLVHFSGAVSYLETPEIYRTHDMFLSTSTTGSVDKAVWKPWRRVFLLLRQMRRLRKCFLLVRFLSCGVPKRLLSVLRRSQTKIVPRWGYERLWRSITASSER